MAQAVIALYVGELYVARVTEVYVPDERGERATRHSSMNMQVKLAEYVHSGSQIALSSNRPNLATIKPNVRW